jgi:hypothetical protein
MFNLEDLERRERYRETNGARFVVCTVLSHSLYPAPLELPG